MRKLLLTMALAGLSLASVAQCVTTCSNYAVSSITYSNFAVGPTNVTSSFVPNTDDGITPLINIGFSFNFYCTTYTQVWICSNGFIQFNDGVPAISLGYADATQSFPNTTAPNSMVALNMNDLDPGSGGSITYTTVGTSPNRQFVVTYSNVPVFGFPTGLHTGQIVLFETSNMIEIHTGTVNNTGTTAGTQGIENSTGTLGATAPGRNNVIWSATNSAYRFAPAYSPMPPAAISGATSVCTGSAESYSIAASPGANYYTWSTPTGWGGSSTTTALSTTVASGGAVQVSATYSCGTSVTTTLSVNAIPLPFVSFTMSPSTICSGNSVTLTSSGASTYTFQPGNIVSNGTTVITPQQNTIYSLAGTSTANCISVNTSSDVVTVNVTPTVSVNSGTVCAGQSFTMQPLGADSYVFSNGFSVVTPTAGVYSYTITGTNSNGCVGEPAVSTLTVSANPTISIAANHSVICKGNASTLTASGADTYSWASGPSTAANVVTPSVTTVFTVTGTSVEGCTKNGLFTVLVDQCVGIGENTAAMDQLLVYPNPSAGEFRMSVPSKMTIFIYDVQGKVVYAETLEQGEHMINMSSVSPGQYLLKAVDNNKAKSVVLVKE